MGRIVEGPTPGSVREFQPESFGNRAEEDPIRIWIKDPTEAEKRTLQLMQTELQFNAGELVKDSDGVPQITVTLQAMAKHQRAAILGHVHKVEGYTVRGVEINNGETLADMGETEILAETALEITMALSLSADEKKD